MVEPQYLAALRVIHARLQDQPPNWAVTGSLGMALQGMDVAVHDIDLQTDEAGAYEIERRLAEYVVKAVRYSESEKMRSHLGLLEIGGIKVEVMGDIRKRLGDGSWDIGVDLESVKGWVDIEGMRTPVLSLEYEYEAYLKLGRTDKADALKEWLEHQDVCWPNHDYH